MSRTEKATATPQIESQPEGVTEPTVEVVMQKLAYLEKVAATLQIENQQLRAAISKTKLAPPSTFNRKRGELRNFFTDLRTYFYHYGLDKFPMEGAKVRYTASFFDKAVIE